MHTRRILTLALIAALSVLAIGSGGRVNAGDSREPVSVPAVPSLTDVSATTGISELFTVTGKDFTSGGRVYLAIYDPMGATLHETRWIAASLPTTVMRHAPGDGALWRSPVALPGGTLREAFGQLCGVPAMMRALDESTATWSDWLTVNSACATYVEPRFGPR